MPGDDRPPIGSNAWAVGGDRTTSGQAILANDPHLDIGIPGIWYLFEGSAPGIHIGGAALAGDAGVTLGTTSTSRGASPPARPRRCA